MYGQMYNQYNAQSSIDRINNQIAELERMKQQISTPIQQQMPTNLTQNFQLAPSNRETIKYANSIDEVQKEIVIGDTPYFSRDMSVVWIKNSKSEIKTYELKEVILKDEKDMLIDSLQMQIEELRKEMRNNAKPINEYVDEPIENTKPTNVSNSKSSKAK